MNLKQQKGKIRNLKLLNLVLIICTVCTIGFLTKDAVVAKFSNYIIENDKLVESLEPTTFLFIGTDEDQTEAEGARSDVLMLVTLTPKNTRGNVEVNVVSIPRDTVAYITCGDYTSRINEAYAIGYNEGGTKAGAECTTATVENYLNIKVDYYVSTSFKGLMDMVDAVGGVPINVQYPFCEQDSKANDCAVEIKAGPQILNGEQALAYCRQRHESSDYERGIRQQEVMMALAKKILSDPTEYMGEVIGVFNKSMTSNLTADIITKMASVAVANYNQFIENQSGDTAIIIQMKTSPYSNELAIDDVMSSVTGVNADNVEPVPFSTIYPTVNDFEQDTMVQEFYFSKRASSMPSHIVDTEKSKPLVIEFQSISILAEEFKSSEGASVSFPQPDTLYYVSNTLRTAVGLPIAQPTYNYNNVKKMGGPVN